MPQLVPCSNTYCSGYTDHVGGLCPDCQRKADQQKADAWKYKGWSREEERKQLQKHKGGSK